MAIKSNHRMSAVQPPGEGGESRVVVAIAAPAPPPHAVTFPTIAPAIAKSAAKPRKAVSTTERGGKEARGLRRADTLIAQGQVDKAIDHLRKLINDLPNSTQGHLRIASLLHEKRQSSEALDILRRIIQRTPQSASAREALSEICLEVGRHHEAIDHSRILLRMTPHSLFARDVLSAAYLQCGQLDDSLRIIREMIQLDPMDASHHFKKGVLLQQKGLLREAAQAFLRVLHMDGDSEAADESRAALEMLDSCQIRQIVTLAVEDIPFRVFLQRAPQEAVSSKGFLLSDGGFTALCQMRFDNLPSAPPGWRHYYYH